MLADFATTRAAGGSAIGGTLGRALAETDAMGAVTDGGDGGASSVVSEGRPWVEPDPVPHAPARMAMSRSEGRAQTGRGMPAM